MQTFCPAKVGQLNADLEILEGFFMTAGWFKKKKKMQFCIFLAQIHIHALIMMISAKYQ